MRVLENPGILQAILESLHSGVYFVGASSSPWVRSVALPKKLATK